MQSSNQSSIPIPLLMILALFGILFLAACSSGGDSPKIVDASDLDALYPLTSMEYCDRLGYPTEPREHNDCENFFVCLFPDGSECHSVLFQQGRCALEFTYCAQQGYEVEMVGDQVRCTFPDGSYCTEQDYLLGECQQGENFP